MALSVKPINGISIDYVVLFVQDFTNDSYKDRKSSASKKIISYSLLRKIKHRHMTPYSFSRKRQEIKECLFGPPEESEKKESSKESGKSGASVESGGSGASSGGSSGGSGSSRYRQGYRMIV